MLAPAGTGTGRSHRSANAASYASSTAIVVQESEEPTLRYADRHRNYPDVLTSIAHFKTRLPWILQGFSPRLYDR